MLNALVQLSKKKKKMALYFYKKKYEKAEVCLGIVLRISIYDVHYELPLPLPLNTFRMKAGGKTARDRVSDDRHDPFCP